MLDELLGQAALKDRIEELEAEAERLERQLEAEQRRRSDAVTDRQAAEERVNRLEDRVAGLEGQLDHDGDDRRSIAYRGTDDVRGDRLATVLGRLESVEAGREGALTAMVVDEVPTAVEAAFGERAALVRRASPCLAVTDDEGVVSAALSPPVAPAPFVEWADGFRIEHEWFRPTGRFALALVRADLFALGEYDGNERVAFEGFESDVQGAHSKGGFSQDRFERRRDAQVDEHLDRCRDAVAARDADRLFVVGEETLLGEFAADADATAAVDATGDPEAALASAFEDFWTARLYRI